MYYNTVSAMLGAPTPIANEEIIVAGYHSAGDGGGGTFIWVPGPLTDDGGIHLQNTAATGHYLRLFSGTVNARWFGTYGDGVTNDTPALQKAINYCIDQNINLHLDSNFSIQTSLNITRLVDSGVYDSDDYFVISGGSIHISTALPIFTTDDDTRLTHKPGYPISQFVRFREVKFTGDVETESYVLDDNRFLRTTFDGCTFTAIKLLTTESFLQSIYLINCQARSWAGIFINTTGGCYDTRITHGLYEAGESFANLSGTLSGHGANGSITHNVIEGLSGYGINYKQTSSLAICFNYFEQNLGGDIIGTDNQDIQHPNRGISHIANQHYFEFPLDEHMQPIYDINHYPVTWGATLGGFSVSNSSNSNMNYFTTSVCEVFNGNAASWNRDNVSTHFGLDKIYFGTNPALNGGIVNYSIMVDKGTIVLNTEITAEHPNAGWICIKAGDSAHAKWTAFGTVNPLQENNGPVLTGAEDLNTFTQDGYYFAVLPASWVITGSNFPVMKRGVLEVFKENSQTLDLVQKYTTIATSSSDKVHSFSRTYYGYGGYWSAWKEVLSSDPGAVSLPAAAVANTAAAATGATPTKAEFDALLAELRTLKTSLTAAGLLS
jgi:hypothetical protein